VRGSSDDLRSIFKSRPSLTGPTFVLAVFVHRIPGWVSIARSSDRSKVDAFAAHLASVFFDPFQVVEVACDPDDVAAVEAAVSALGVVDDELIHHFHHPVREGI
jgi:hypothetical protein